MKHGKKGVSQAKENLLKFQNPNHNMDSQIIFHFG